MKVTYDPAKRAKTLAERGLDFKDAPEVFAELIYEFEDRRKDYGEARMLCFGMLRGRLVTVGYVQRGKTRHIFTMRKANEKEKATFGQQLS